MRVDAHHHLWQYNAKDFGWIEDAAAALRRDFLPQEFATVLASAEVDASVVVQARQSLDETAWLLACAEQSRAIAGVVGWVPLADGRVSSILRELCGHPRFVGVREIVQDQAAGFLLDPALNEGICHLTAHDLTYDLLIRCGQLEEAIRFVDLHPNQRFVLDHAAKPPIARREREPWATSLRRLGQRGNVLCKLSGLVTEADWRRWTEADLHPYLEACLEAFGPQRCMAGSDWPVCLVASSYADWWGLLERWVQPLSVAEQQQIRGGAAASFYGLEATLASGVRG